MDDRRWLHTLKIAQMLLIRFGLVIAPLSCRIYIAACGSHNVFFKFDIAVHFRDSDCNFGTLDHKEKMSPQSTSRMQHVYWGSGGRERETEATSLLSLTLGFTGKKRYKN